MFQYHSCSGVGDDLLASDAESSPFGHRWSDESDGADPAADAAEPREELPYQELALCRGELTSRDCMGSSGTQSGPPSAGQ